MVAVQGLPSHAEEGPCTQVEALDSGAPAAQPAPSLDGAAPSLGDHHASIMPAIPPTSHPPNEPLLAHAQPSNQGRSPCPLPQLVITCCRPRWPASHRCDGWLTPALLGLERGQPGLGWWPDLGFPDHHCHLSIPLDGQGGFTLHGMMAKGSSH